MSGAEILYQGITEIDDELIEAAQSYGVQGDYGTVKYRKNVQRFWLRWGGYSICAAIVVAVLLVLPVNRVEMPEGIQEE